MINIKRLNKHNKKIINDRNTAIMNIASPVASALSSVTNPVLLGIPVFSSVMSEINSHYNSDMEAKRFNFLFAELEKCNLKIDDLKQIVAEMNEHSKYVLRNNLSAFCFKALPETAELYIKVLISYIKESKRDLIEEICEIVSELNSNDVRLLEYIKEYLRQGERDKYREKLADYNDDMQSDDKKVWHDRNVIYDVNTVFWEDFTVHFNITSAKNLGIILNINGTNESGEICYDWTCMGRSFLKLHNLGVLEFDAINYPACISQTTFDRFHITIFGQKLLEYV